MTIWFTDNRGTKKWLNYNKSGRYKTGNYDGSVTYIDILYTGLTDCWTGFKASKAHRDYDLMEYYARGVNKFLRLLHKPEVDFDVLRPDFNNYKLKKI